jgi:2-keto-4-pentenoate hydratase/2-oxohepta-3-ene-1,7-dioic acid hydratase in catechol pathway
MKLLRYGEPGQEKPGVLDDDGQIRDLSGVVPDLKGENLNAEIISRGLIGSINGLPLVEGSPRLGPCVAGCGKFICIGMNYRDHAEEQNLDIPSEPVLFMKATSAICGPNDNIEIPKKSKKTDWEVELGVVIGREAKYVSEENALDHVVGYCVINDVSEREFQIEREGQWVKGKSCDTFGPIGPYLVTKDEIPDPQTLDVWLEVNGHRYQESNTDQMAYGVAFLVSYISQFMSLQPGDIISTGTPGGVGIFLPEPTFLKPDDVVTLGIENLGVQTQKVVQG